MVLRKISTRISNNSGFTLAEVVIVVGIIAFSGGIAAFATETQLRGSSFQDERNQAVFMLEHARAQAIANVCSASACTGGSSHGVLFSPHTLILFEGASFATRDQSFDVTIALLRAIVATDTEVVFQHGSGIPSASTTITLRDETGNESIISIGAEGETAWTH